MDWAVNDTLKAKAYGMKQEMDIYDKVDRNQKAGNQYYPVDRGGKVDEWGALVQHISKQNAE